MELANSEGDDGRRKRERGDEVGFEVQQVHVHRGKGGAPRVRQLGRRFRRSCCARRKEQVDAVDVPLPRGVVNRRLAELVARVDVRPGLEEDVDRLGVPFAARMRERRRLRVLVGDVDAREPSSGFDEEAEDAGVTFAGGEVLRVVPCGVGKDLGPALEEDSSNVLMAKLAGEGERVEVLVRRRGSFEADALVDKGLDDGVATVGDGVDDGAVAVEVGDGGIGAGGEEEAADFGVPVDGRVVERVAAVDVGLGDGDALLEADGGESVATCAGSLDRTKSAAVGRERWRNTNLVESRSTVDVVDVHEVE